MSGVGDFSEGHVVGPYSYKPAEHIKAGDGYVICDEFGQRLEPLHVVNWLNMCAQQQGPEPKPMNAGELPKEWSRPWMPKIDKGYMLHLGAGTRILPGYMTIDKRSEVQPDIEGNVEDLSMFPDASAKVIYACHVLEHMPRPHVLTVLEEWRRVLEPGGLLRVSVPDFAVLADLYVYDAVSMWRLIGPLMGGQRHSEDFHHISFDKEYLSWLLTEAGYIHIRRWHAGKVHPVSYDDYSLARIDGRYISLNLEAQAK